jgi:membrane protein involved in colicin uptake
MGSRLGGGIRGLFSARIYVDQQATTDDVAQRHGQEQDSSVMRVFLRAGRTRKTKEALVARNAAEEKRLLEAPAKAAAKAAREERAAARRKERAIESAKRAKVRRAQDALARAQRTAELAEQHAAMLERRRQTREAAELALRQKAEAKAERHAASVRRRKARDRKEAAVKYGRMFGMCVATIVVRCSPRVVRCLPLCTVLLGSFLGVSDVFLHIV